MYCKRLITIKSDILKYYSNKKVIIKFEYTHFYYLEIILLLYIGECYSQHVKFKPYYSNTENQYNLKGVTI